MNHPCPNSWCHGFLDEGCCTGCGKNGSPYDGLGGFPPPAQARRIQDEREDFAVREAA